ncbi:YjgF-like protein [Trichocladium antarcticum]|uniref:YjgF-like protein n=1 Tax=Trichocladium antarcticum TaxID=1450529 RepID=A0AAN6UEZ5_9PEZI|nr:YjgF-like protein [Trichocladium antarcticum]
MEPPKAVLTANAPPPIPQLSQAIKHNGLVYCSGSLGVSPATGEFVAGTVKDRTRQTLKNMSAVLEAAGSSLGNVVKVNIFLTSMADFAAVNEVYDEFFTSLPKPCRTCVAVHQLPMGTDVEIECTAVETVKARL